MSEQLLAGGDVNVVVRFGHTVRRPTGAWSPAVHALLRHFEAVGGDALHHRLGGVERRPGWKGTWDAGSGERIRANAARVVTHRRALEAALA